MISRIKIQKGHKKAEKSQNAFCEFCAFLWRIPSSGHDIGHGSRANRSSAFPDRESQSFLQRHRRDQLNGQVHVIARHDHLHPFGQICRPGHIRRPKIKLRPVSLKERRVPSPFFLRQHIHFRLELRVRRDRCPLGHHLSPLDFFLLGPSQQQSHVVAGLPFIQALLHPPEIPRPSAVPALPPPPIPATPDLPPRRTCSKTPRCRAPPPAAPTKFARASAASARPSPPPPISPHPSAPPP